MNPSGLGVEYAQSPATAGRGVIGGLAGGAGRGVVGPSGGPNKADIDAILGGSGSSGGGGMKSGVSYDINDPAVERQSAIRVAEHYKTRPNEAMPASTRAYLDKMGFGSGAEGGGGAPPSGNLTNTTAPNPVSNNAIDELMARYKGNNTAGLDDSIRKLRANASMGIAGEAAAARARSGASGSSQDSVDARSIAQGTEHNINSLTTDFVLGREKEKDSLLQAAGGMGLAQGSQQLAGNAQAFNQYATQQNLDMQKKNDYLRNLSIISNLLDKPAQNVI